jgi:hypothetical protein
VLDVRLAFSPPIDTMVWLGTVIFVATLVMSLVIGAVTSRAGDLIARETEQVAA